MPVRVALVEDNATVRRRFVERFRFFEDVELVLAAGSGEAFVQALAALPAAQRPQVVLMDIELPGISGIETTARLHKDHPEIDVMMLTVFEHEDKIFASIQAGASGYLLKDASTDKIVGAILELARGGAPMSPAVARKMLAFVRATEQAAQDAAPPDQDAFDLSARELELLEYLVQDEPEPIIADRLHISPHTVRTHIKNIYKKLHVHSRASAVRVTLEQRLLGKKR
jgi:DNA-binding NarL/FixJ family response regulator